MKIILDSTIEFQHPISENWQNPKAIFLTGSTGFLGAFLLNELLKQTTANIYCLLRGDGLEKPSSLLNRIEKNLQFYGLWEEKLASRIIPIVGDLSLPLLGIYQEKFEQIAEEIDVIYHNGAWVNSACPYSTLEATNVLGTQEVLRLASLTQTKPIHFVSTIAVFFSKNYSPNREVKETEIPDVSALQGGYRKSKAAAENLVFQAKERGLPVCIYRPSRIAGDSKTGINGNTTDFFWSLLKGCIQLGKIPALETGINLVPVDYVSQAIVSLSQQQQSFGKAFNLLNPQPLSWQKLFEEISALGYPVEKVSYDELLREVEKYVAKNPEDELYSSLLLFLSDPETLRAKKPRFDTSNTKEGLASGAIACPPADKKLLETYISYFQKSGYLRNPVFLKNRVSENQSQPPKKTSGFWKSIKSNIKSKNTAFAIKPTSRNGNLPLSFAQERLWLLEQLHPGNPVHNLRAVYRLKGTVNVAALEQSIQEIVRRHEILRTTFSVVNGQPVQVISPDATIKLPVIDLGHLSVEEREAEVRRQAAQEAQQSFDLTRGPLLSVKLLRLGEAEYVLIRTIHHIINDVWSDTVLLREVAKLYEAFCAGKPSPLPELSIQYVDFARSQREWLQGEVLKSQLDYWKQQLGGNISLLDLPVKKSSAKLPSYRGAARVLVLSENLTKEIKALSHKEGVSLFVALLAAFKTLLYQYSGQTDVILASPVVGRQQMETKKLLGYFTNILLLRTDLGKNPSFRQLIGRVSQVTLAATERQYLPFQQLVESVGVSSATLSRVMFTLQNVPSQPEKLAEVGVSLVEMDEGIANFDLSLSVKEKGDRLVGVMRYKTDLFEESAIEQMLDNFQNLLETLVAEPEIFLGDLPIFAETKSLGELEKSVKADCVLPQNEIESIIAGIWQEVLQIEKIGIDENFFELGGRSLAIIRVYSKLREIYDLEIAPGELFQHQTIGEMALLLTQTPSLETAKDT
jgi:thioester reductase-like protein